ncbi:unnamed protein product, partial [Symbiodinium sp. CCMP2456]
EPLRLRSMDERDKYLLWNRDPPADAGKNEEEPNLSQATTLILPGDAENPPLLPEMQSKNVKKPLPEEKPQPEPVKEALKEEDKEDTKKANLKRLKVSLELDV